MAATLQQVDARVRKGDAHDASRLAPFAQQLFRKADDAFLATFDADALFAMAKQGMAFLEGLAEDDDAMRVEVVNPAFAADGWACDCTVVRLALHDRPFVVDSVRAEVRGQGFEVDHVLHPVFAIARDEARRIVEVADRLHLALGPDEGTGAPSPHANVDEIARLRQELDALLERLGRH
ncbi:MAG: NAD-glutamate dehydrogenase, partial [Trueperaceae bacterium]|nr:NAD-glutamate dehydrogenase [Trueperaceae bacterium]